MWRDSRRAPLSGQPNLRRISPLLAGLDDLRKLVYLIQLEQDDPDAFWINEVWADKASYEACLTMPQVQQGMAATRSLIAGVEVRVEAIPLGVFD